MTWAVNIWSEVYPMQVAIIIAAIVAGALIHARIVNGYWG